MCVSMIGNQRYVTIYFASVANLKCTPRGTCTPGWEPLL